MEEGGGLTEPRQVSKIQNCAHTANRNTYVVFFLIVLLLIREIRQKP